MRRVMYQLEIVKKRAARSKAALRELYQKILRHRGLAAQVHVLHPGPGEVIRSLRKEFIDAQPVTRRRLVSVKHKIQVPYGPADRRGALESLRQEIRSFRKNQRGDGEAVNLDRWGWDAKGFTHHSSSDIARCFCKKALGVRKSPATPERHVGIEIECFVPRDFDELSLLAFKAWLNVGTDGSITPPDGMRSVELRVLCTEGNFRERISSLCEALTRADAGVNASCGLHVHLDMRNLQEPEIKKRYINLVRFQNWLFQLVPPSRQENRYCRRTRSLDPFGANDRYQAINAVALQAHQTLEVRLHSGTTNAEKIIHWVTLLLAITDAPEVKRPPQTVEALSRRLALPPEVVQYIESRRALFQNGSQNEPEVLQCANS